METIGLITSQEMIITGLKAKNAEDVMQKLCGRALQNNYITPEFMTALTEREKEYPTGLPTGVPIAIPHIHDGCLKSFFSMAITEEPVTFGCMGDPDEKIETRLIFLFGITDPGCQTAVLRKFSSIFQDDEVMNELLLIHSPNILLKKMKELLDDYLITKEWEGEHET